ncbi:uncharacterized protein LOC127702030 [Mytilus californianus]|uniref:uncharacterized protein LOC127702030 n=1 Tax=Mytilus californianus TaxID=6549 RepID=UPI0022472A1D|nr:uncharacterized protein LOC127702030 [Mytilus californianus]
MATRESLNKLHLSSIKVFATEHEIETTQNFKGLDKAVQHFDVDDIQEVGMAHAMKILHDTCSHNKTYCL